MLQNHSDKKAYPEAFVIQQRIENIKGSTKFVKPTIKSRQLNYTFTNLSEKREKESLRTNQLSRFN